MGYQRLWRTGAGSARGDLGTRRRYTYGIERKHQVRALLASAVVAALLPGCVVVTERREPPPEQPSAGQGQGSGQSQNGYSFLHTLDNGEPVRWSTCEPIRYVVRPANRPAGAERLLEDSISRISEASGLEFSAEGTTDEAPSDDRPLYDPDRYGDQWAPVLIAYSDADEYERLAGQAAGYGGAAYVQQGGAVPRYVSGTAVFDVDQITELGGEEAMRAVMLHELAHVVGLGHVQDRSQLMNPVQYGRGVTELQEGDLAGLEAVGDGKCYEPVEPRSIRD